MITLNARIRTASEEEIVVNKRNCMSISYSSIDRKETEMPSWGIISNGGTIEFKDPLGKTKELSKNLKLIKPATVVLSLKNTITDADYQLGTFYSTKWSFDDDNKIAHMDFSDGLEKMQSIEIQPLEFDLGRTEYTDSAKIIYEYLRNQSINNGFPCLNFELLDVATQKIINDTTILFANTQKGNLWNLWEEFGIALQLHVFRNRQGQLISVYRGGD